MLALLAVVQIDALQAKKKEVQTWKYEVEPIEMVGAKGTVSFKVWSYGRTAKEATDQAFRNGVHAVIFKGIPNTTRVAGFKPLVEKLSVMDENQAFFDTFFAEGGEYARFITHSTTGQVGAGDVLKVNNKEYKVGVTVTVSQSQLRERLEDEKIVKSMTSIF